MLDWLDIMEEQERFRELIRRGEHETLVREARQGQPGRTAGFMRVVAWLKEKLASRSWKPEAPAMPAEPCGTEPC